MEIAAEKREHGEHAPPSFPRTITLRAPPPPLRWRHCSEYANRFTW